MAAPFVRIAAKDAVKLADGAAVAYALSVFVDIPGKVSEGRHRHFTKMGAQAVLEIVKRTRVRLERHDKTMIDERKEVRLIIVESAAPLTDDDWANNPWDLLRDKAFWKAGLARAIADYESTDVR
jgi:hypothetical protein